MNIFQKIKLARRASQAIDEFEEGLKMKNSTKIIGGGLMLATALAEAFQKDIVAFVVHHPTVGILIVGVIKILLLVRDPKDSDAIQQALNQKGSCSMRTIFTMLVIGLIALCAFPAVAQEPLPTNFYAAGVSFNQSASPAVAGTALYAHKVADVGTYAFTVADFLPVSTRPFTVTSNVGVGVAQKAFTIDKVPIYVPTSAGISFTGSNTGWSWTTGAMAAIKVKGNFRVMPSVRVLKSSVSAGTGYQPIVAVLFGWGQ